MVVRIGESGKFLVQNGLKLTQTNLAQFAEVTQGRISQIAAQFGTWQDFQKLLMALIEITTSAANNSEPAAEMPPDVLWFVENYLPLALDDSPVDTLKALAAHIKEFGSNLFNAVALTFPELRGKLMGLVLSLLPEYLQSECLAILHGSS